MNRTKLIQFLRENEIWAKRTMGQNFLLDDSVLTKIVSAADIKPTDTVVEIGPGLGVLTEELSKRAGRVIAIEKDSELFRQLQVESNKWQVKNLEIINGDALKLFTFYLPPSTYKVVANIPYNITSVIIRKFLEADNKPELMVLMVQKEVAQRITAKPGEMSLLSVAVQFYADAKIVGIVKNTSFFPVPKIDSAIIKLIVKSQQLTADEKSFFRLVKFGFAARRKTLENNLAAGLHITKSEASDIIKKTGLKEKIRAQELAFDDWIKLSEVINGEKGN